MKLIQTSDNEGHTAPKVPRIKTSDIGGFRLREGLRDMWDHFCTHYKRDILTWLKLIYVKLPYRKVCKNVPQSLTIVKTSLTRAF